MACMSSTTYNVTLTHLEASGSQAITYEEFADLIYGPRLAVGDSPQEAQDCSAGEC